MGRSRRRKGSSGYSSDSGGSVQSQLIDRKTGNYIVQETWHEGLHVARGTAQRRLDMSHGFFVDILRNQTGRADYEDAWQMEKAKLEEVGDYKARPKAMQGFRGKRYDRQELCALASRSSSSSTSSDCNFSPPGFQASSATPPQRRRNTTKPSPPRLQPKTSSSPHAPAAVSAQPASRLAVASIRAATQACQPRAVSSAQSQQLVERQPAVPSVSKQSGSQSQPLPPPAGLSDANAIPVRSFAAHQPAERPIQPVPQQQLRQHRQRSEPRPLPVQQPGRMSSVNSIPVASHTRPGGDAADCAAPLRGDWEAAAVDTAAEPVTPAQLLHGAPAHGFVVGRPLIDGLVLGIPAPVSNVTTGDWDSIASADLQEAQQLGAQAAPSVTRSDELSRNEAPRKRAVRVRQGHQTYQPPSAFQPAAVQQKGQSAASPPERPATPLQQERSLVHSSPVVNEQPTWDVLLDAAASLTPTPATLPPQKPVQMSHPQAQAAAPARRRLSQVIADLAAAEAQPQQQQQPPPAKHTQGWSEDAPALPQTTTWTLNRKDFATSYWSDCEDAAPARKQHPGRARAAFAWCSTGKPSVQQPAAAQQPEPLPAQQPNTGSTQQKGSRKIAPAGATGQGEVLAQASAGQVSASVQQQKGGRRQGRSLRKAAADSTATQPGAAVNKAVKGDWLAAEPEASETIPEKPISRGPAMQPERKPAARRKARSAGRTSALQPTAGVKPAVPHVCGDGLAAEEDVATAPLVSSTPSKDVGTFSGRQRNAVTSSHRPHASRRPDAALYQPGAGAARGSSA